MCRWLAYTGSAVQLDELLLNPDNSLIQQSLHARLGTTTTNGDGFGIGWYDPTPEPGVFHSIEPAWNDPNIRELARHLSSRLVFAHVRASTGTAIQKTNCHPFRYRHWLWMHNGLIREFKTLKRDLALAVDPSLFPELEGSTDSELFFYLALSMGLQDNPPLAVARAAGVIESIAAGHDIDNPLLMTVATTDGITVWTFRYSSARSSASLFYSTDVQTLRERYPANELLDKLSDESRLVASEPLGDLEGVWNAVPESSYCVLRQGQCEMNAFEPVAT